MMSWHAHNTLGTFIDGDFGLSSVRVDSILPINNYNAKQARISRHTAQRPCLSPLKRRITTRCMPLTRWSASPLKHRLKSPGQHRNKRTAQYSGQGHERTEKTTRSTRRPNSKRSAEAAAVAPEQRWPGLRQLRARRRAIGSGARNPAAATQDAVRVGKCSNRAPSPMTSSAGVESPRSRHMH